MSFDKRPLGQSPPRLRGSFWHAAAGLLALTSLPVIGCGPVGDDAEATSQSQLGEAHQVTATFTNCIEFGGVGLVPTANIQDRIPSQYILIPGPPGLSIFVAHMAKCQEIKVGNGAGRPGLMGHLGALIIPPTGTGNFNNYLFSHVTDDPGLFAAPKGSGPRATALNPHKRFAVLGSGSDTTLSAAAQKPQVLVFGPSGSFFLSDAS